MTRYLRNLWQAIRNKYDGAEWSPRRSRAYGTPQSARFDVNASTRLQLLTQSRDFEANDATANRIGDIWETYTVGTGPHVQPASSSADWNVAAREWWTGWERYCDDTSLMGFSALMSLASRIWLFDGEAFIIWTKGREGTPRIQLLEGHNFSTPPDQSKREGISVIDGVEIDPSGRPTGYWRSHAKDSSGKVRFELIPAEAVIHLFEPSRPGQYRGITLFYPVINDLLDLKDLRLLEMSRAKDAAEITNVIKNEIGELSGQELRQSRFGIPTASEAGNPVDKIGYYREAVAGRSVVLKRGDSIEQFRSESPNVATQFHWKYLEERVCTGVGVPYVMVYPDSMQGTVYRGSLDTAAATFRARSLVIGEVVRRVWVRVMGWARYGVPTLRDVPGNWDNVIIRPPRAPNVDVGRNSSAMLAELSVGATNYNQIYAPAGLDWRTEFDQLLEQQEYARSIGLVLPGVAPRQPDRTQELVPATK